MSWPDLASNFFKAVIALIGAMVMDYALLDGRMTRQAVTGLERMADDMPVQLNRLVKSAINIDWNR